MPGLKLGLLVMLACSAAAADGVALRDELLTRIEKDQQARFAGIAWAAEHGADGIVDEASLTEQERRRGKHSMAEADRAAARVAHVLRGRN